eukprot:scaffold403880_cov18-Prasinocladus_malaysianus.AAC.1
MGKAATLVRWPLSSTPSGVPCKPARVDKRNIGEAPMPSCLSQSNTWRHSQLYAFTTSSQSSQLSGHDDVSFYIYVKVNCVDYMQTLLMH